MNHTKEHELKNLRSTYAYLRHMVEGSRRYAYLDLAVSDKHYVVYNTKLTCYCLVDCLRLYW